MSKFARFMLGLWVLWATVQIVTLVEDSVLLGLFFVFSALTATTIWMLA